MYLLQMTFSKYNSNSEKNFLLMNINLSFLKFHEAFYMRKKKNN